MLASTICHVANLPLTNVHYRCPRRQRSCVRLQSQLLQQRVTQPTSTPTKSNVSHQCRFTQLSTKPTHQLTRSVKVAAADIPVRCEDKCFDGLDSKSWVTGWELPLRKSVQRVFTPDKPSTFDLTNTFRRFFPTGETESAARTPSSCFSASSAPTLTTAIEAQPCPSSFVWGSDQNVFRGLFSGFSLVDSVRYG